MTLRVIHDESENRIYWFGKCIWDNYPICRKCVWSRLRVIQTCNDRYAIKPTCEHPLYGDIGTGRGDCPKIRGASNEVFWTQVNADYIATEWDIYDYL